MLIDNRQWWTIRHLLDCNGWILPEILRISPTVSAGAMETIDLSTPLRLGTAFRFPLQHQLARRELLWGAFLLLVLPGVGWLLNMGHRIQMVHNMQHGRAVLARLGRLPALAQVGYGHLPGHGRVPPARDLHRAAGLAARDRLALADRGGTRDRGDRRRAGLHVALLRRVRRLGGLQPLQGPASGLPGGGVIGTPGRSPSRPSPPRSPGCWPWASASWSRASGSGKWPGSASRRSSRSGSGSDRQRDGSARQSGEDDLARGPHGPPLPFVTPTDGIRL